MGLKIGSVLFHSNSLYYSMKLKGISGFFEERNSLISENYILLNCLLFYRHKLHISCNFRGIYVEKNAKIWPRGISFTASNCAIVYLVDQAGTRSTSDQFHDLYSEDSSECKFLLILHIYIVLFIEVVIGVAARSIVL